MHVVNSGGRSDVHSRLLHLQHGHAALFSDLGTVDVELSYVLCVCHFISGGNLGPLKEVVGQVVFEAYESVFGVLKSSSLNVD